MTGAGGTAIPARATTSILAGVRHAVAARAATEVASAAALAAVAAKEVRPVASAADSAAIAALANAHVSCGRPLRSSTSASNASA